MITLNGVKKYYLVLRDLKQIFKLYKKEGATVKKFNGTINGRPAYYINGDLMADYQILSKFEHDNQYN